VLPPESSQTDGGNPVQGNQTLPPNFFFGDQALCVFILQIKISKVEKEFFPLIRCTLLKQKILKYLNR
jgi:hypothetical protein